MNAGTQRHQGLSQPIEVKVEVKVQESDYMLTTDKSSNDLERQFHRKQKDQSDLDAEYTTIRSDVREGMIRRPRGPNGTSERGFIFSNNERCTRCIQKHFSECKVFKEPFLQLDDYVSQVLSGTTVRKGRRPKSSSCFACKEGSSPFCHFPITREKLGPGYTHAHNKGPFPVPLDATERPVAPGDIAFSTKRTRRRVSSRNSTIHSESPSISGSTSSTSTRSSTPENEILDLSTSIIVRRKPEGLIASSSAGSDLTSRPAKRKLNAGQPPPHPTLPVEDETFYITGTFCVFNVDGRLFRVPTFPFTKESAKFWTLNKISPPSCEPKSPIVLLDVRHEEFRSLLKVLFPIFSAPENADLSKGEWSSVLKLSTQWIFPRIRTRAIHEIKCKCSSAEQVAIGLQFNVSSLFIEGLNDLIQREEYGDSSENELTTDTLLPGLNNRVEILRESNLGRDDILWRMRKIEKVFKDELEEIYRKEKVFRVDGELVGRPKKKTRLANGLG